MSTAELHNEYPNPIYLIPGDKIEIRSPNGASYLFIGNIHTVINSTPESVIISSNGSNLIHEWRCRDNEKYHFFKLINKEHTTDSIIKQLDNLSEKIERELISNN